MFKEKHIWVAMTTLSIIGIILATYLLYNFYNQTPSTICNISNKVNCNEVIKGSLSTFAGIPVSLVGLIGYAVILFSSLTKKKTISLFMTTFGMFFCLRLTILELFFVKVYCPVCIACQIIMILVFVGSIKLNSKLLKGKQK